MLVRSLSKNIVWVLFGNIFYAVSQWAIIVIIAQRLGPEGVGRYILSLSVVSPIILLFNLQLRSVLVSDVGNTHSFYNYLQVRLISSSLAFIVSLVIVTLYLGESFFVLSASVILMKFLESFSDIYYGLVQKNERMDILSKSLVLRGGISVVVFYLSMNAFEDLILSLLLLSVSWALIFIMYDVRMGATVKGGVSYRELGNCLKTALFCLRTNKNIIYSAVPLGMTMMIISLNSNLPRYLIEGSFGVETLGIFSAIFYFTIAGSQVVNAIGQSASPRLAKYFFDSKICKFKLLVYKLNSLVLIISLLGVAVAFLFNDEILRVFYGNEYIGYGNLFVAIMLCGLFIYFQSISAFYLTALRIFKFQVYANVIYTISFIIFSMIFMEKLEIMGIILSVSISAIIVFLLNLYILNKSLNRKEESYV